MLLLWALAPAAVAVTDNVGILSPTPVSRTVDHGSGIFLDTINFQADATNILLFVTSTTNGIDSFSTPLFENTTDTEVHPDNDGEISGFALIPGPPGYHIHPQGLVQGTSGTYTVELSAAAAAVGVSAPVPAQTREDGGSVQITLTLNAAASDVLSIPLSVSAPAEAMVDPVVVEFMNGETGPKTVTVTGLPDGVVDGNQSYQLQIGIVAGADTRYAGLDPADVDLTNLDIDGNIAVSTLNGTVSEGGAAASFDLSLNLSPTDAVSIPLTVSNPAEVAVNPGVLVFPAGVAAGATQTATVTGIDDALADGDQAFTVMAGPATSADTRFDGVTVSLSGVNLDDDVSPAILLINAGGLVTDEDGAGAQFQVALASTPTADVRIALSVSHPQEAQIDPPELLFTPANATMPQTVRLTGLADGVEDDDVPYFVLFGAAQSADPDYADRTPTTQVSVVNLNTDRDIPQPENSYGGISGGCSLAPLPATLSGDFSWPLIIALLMWLNIRRRHSAPGVSR
jgi:hypothetical protein